MEYDVVIGLEIHCELKTQSKMFSASPVNFGAPANSCVNEVDLGHPGYMPCVNREAIRMAIMACSALHLTIDPLVKFDRKNYYYADLPKGFQITQQFHPIGRNGYILIKKSDGSTKKVRINRIHMEEDTAKQFHLSDATLIDFNRAGTPLIEIVSEPDMENGAEAASYVENLRQTLLYLGVSDVKMEEGSLRCDVNVSLKPKGSNVFGVKNEIKNLNSISNVEKAIDYEIARQKDILDNGGVIEQATRRFDEATKTTVLMRKKEGNVDYKFFPEPNIFPIRLDQTWIDAIVNNLPELPDAKKARFVDQYGLSDYDADVLVANMGLCACFEALANGCTNKKMAANWMISDVLAYANKNDIDLTSLKDKMDGLAKLINMVDTKEISNKQAKQLFEDVLNGQDAEKLAKAKGMKQMSDPSAIQGWIHAVLDANPQSISDYAGGKDRALGYLVGQVMKLSKGQANPGLANQMMVESLKQRIG